MLKRVLKMAWNSLRTADAAQGEAGTAKADAALQKNRATLASLAIVTVFLAMIASWDILRVRTSVKIAAANRMSTTPRIPPAITTQSFSWRLPARAIAARIALETPGEMSGLIVFGGGSDSGTKKRSWALAGTFPVSRW